MMAMKCGIDGIGGCEWNAVQWEEWSGREGNQRKLQSFSYPRVKFDDRYVLSPPVVSRPVFPAPLLCLYLIVGHLLLVNTLI